jgi:hypothetical protein
MRRDIRDNLNVPTVEEGIVLAQRSMCSRSSVELNKGHVPLPAARPRLSDVNHSSNVSEDLPEFRQLHISG